MSVCQTKGVQLVLFTILILLVGGVGGCARTVIGTAADTALTVVKVPIKAGSAIIGAIDDDDED